MDGLLDYIFSNLDIENLEAQQVKEHLAYLREIAPQIRTTEESVKFLRYRVRLTQQLVNIDCKRVRAFPQSFGQ